MRENFAENQGGVTIVHIDQITTKGDGNLERGESYSREDIDFGAASHLNIHQEGKIAGSQFNNEVIANPDSIIGLLKEQLPAELQYDQFDRSELTIEFSTAEHKPLGWTGVKSIEDVLLMNPDIQIIRAERMEGGMPDEVEGAQGNWYPEMVKDPESGKFIIAKDEEGNVKNEKAKFEPLANIARIPEESFGSTLETNKLTVIIQKDKTTGKPAVLTIFPGENAPAFPAKIDTESYKANSLNQESQEARFWNSHVFLR